MMNKTRNIILTLVLSLGLIFTGSQVTEAYALSTAKYVNTDVAIKTQADRIKDTVAVNKKFEMKNMILEANFAKSKADAKLTLDKDLKKASSNKVKIKKAYEKYDAEITKIKSTYDKQFKQLKFDHYQDLQSLKKMYSTKIQYS